MDLLAFFTTPGNIIYGKISYWAIIATIYLIILTYQDYKKKMLVDDRFNYLMLGVTFSLLSHIKRPLWFILFVFVVIIFMTVLFTKVKSVGAADTKTLSWLFYGFCIINISALAFYAAVFLACVVVYNVVKLYVFKYKQPTPFYPVILIPFIITAVTYGLY